MSQIEELQSRITAAMDRIGAGIEVLAARPAAGAGEPDADLAAALEEEKLANAQLGERLKSIKARHGDEIQALRDELDRAAEVDGLKTEIAALKAELGDTSKSQAQQAELDKARAEVDSLTAQNETLRAEAEAHKAEAEKLRSDAAALDAKMDKLGVETEAQSTTMARLDMDVQRVRQSNDQLRLVNAGLRKANQENVGEPHLINKAMLAELEGLRASRATDAAEASAVLSKLETLLANATNLPQGEDE